MSYCWIAAEEEQVTLSFPDWARISMTMKRQDLSLAFLSSCVQIQHLQLEDMEDFAPTRVNSWIDEHLD
jgi:macrodomain Ter protein organizer (MatP/YcbG family)